METIPDKKTNIDRKGGNKLDYSRPLDIWIWSNKPEIKLSADFIFGKMRGGIPKGFKEDRLLNHLKVILTDLFVAHKASTKLYITVPMDKNGYKPLKKCKKLYLNYKYVKYIINFLNANGYIEFHKGIHFPRCSKMSRMKAADKLLRLFRKYRSNAGVVLRRIPPIILRDTAKNDQDFDIDQLEVKNYIQAVNRINKCLSSHDVSAVIYGQFYWQDFMIDFPKYKDKVKYVRIFNNADWHQGGRFYGHWSQNIKSEYRQFITIDGQETVELDFSCLHLTMLYGLSGLIPPKGDLYAFPAINDCYRPLVKKAVNIAINAENRREALFALRDEYNKSELNLEAMPSPGKLLEIILDGHSQIEKYFMTGYGVRLQYIDSQIAEKILVRLAVENICCLCIHDSFIVARQHKQQLEDLMRQYFFDRFNFMPRITVH